MSLQEKLEERKQSIYFIALNKNLELMGKTVAKGLDLPVDQKDLVKAAKQSDGFDFSRILKHMCLILGLDPQFVHREEYILMLNGMIKSPFQYALSLGVDAVKRGDLLDAICYFNAATVLAPEQSDGYVSLAKACYQYYVDGQDKEALQRSLLAFHRAEQLLATALNAYYLAYIYFSKERFITALAYAERALQRGISGDERLDLIENMQLFEDKARYEQGYKLVIDQRYQEGLEALLSISELAADHWRVQFFTGLAYRGIGSIDRALMHFNKAHDLHPAQAAVNAERALALLSLGQIGAARQALAEGFAATPRSTELFCAAALIEHVDGTVQRAEQFLALAEKYGADQADLAATRRTIEQLKRDYS